MLTLIGKQPEKSPPSKVRDHAVHSMHFFPYLLSKAQSGYIKEAMIPFLSNKSLIAPNLMEIRAAMEGGLILLFNTSKIKELQLINNTPIQAEMEIVK